MKLTDLKAFLSISSEERLVLGLAFLHLVKNQLRVSFRGRQIVRELQPRASELSLRSHVSENIVLKSVNRAAHRLWPRPNCLAQALTVRDLLWREQRTSEIRLLVRREPSGDLLFHAVVAQDGFIVFGLDEDWTDGAALLKSEEQHG